MKKREREIVEEREKERLCRRERNSDYGEEKEIMEKREKEIL